MVKGFVIFYFYITTSQVVRGGVQVNRDEVIEEKGPLFEVGYHSILLSLCLQHIHQRPILNGFLHACLQAPNLMIVNCSCNFKNDIQVLSEKCYCREI